MLPFSHLYLPLVAQRSNKQIRQYLEYHSYLPTNMSCLPEGEEWNGSVYFRAQNLAIMYGSTKPSDFEAQAQAEWDSFQLKYQNTNTSCLRPDAGEDTDEDFEEPDSRSLDFMIETGQIQLRTIKVQQDEIKKLEADIEALERGNEVVVELKTRCEIKDSIIGIQKDEIDQQKVHIEKLAKKLAAVREEVKNKDIMIEALEDTLRARDGDNAAFK